MTKKPDILETSERSFRFIDLFAGIGGFRMAFEGAGGKCVYSSEWDKFARHTYSSNFGAPEDEIGGDITKVEASDIPHHDVLLGGFPCQPFSLAGVSKKNSLGRAHGFDDPTQGTLFFHIKRILDHHRPQAFVLENVKHLLSHDRGNTFRVISTVLQHELGYDLHVKVLDGSYFVPQSRQRIIMVGFDGETSFSWDQLVVPSSKPPLSEILHRIDGSEPFVESDGDRFFNHKKNRVQPKYTLTQNLWKYLQAYAEKHREAGNGFGYGLVGPDDTARTLSARYHKDGSEILVRNRPRPRRLTPRECARLMGFPDSFEIPVSDTQAYRQFGNSVIVPAISSVARTVTPHLHQTKVQ
jgi:DNA (cytosine-5)-methyltransferase 1